MEFTEPQLESFENKLKSLLWYFKPQYLNSENVPANKPCMFVVNHSIYAIADALVIHAIFKSTGRYPRTMADRNHFKVPLWRHFMLTHGAISGDRKHCAELMEQQQDILVFPGGQREVLKRKGEAYQLIWKQRFGFLKLAHQYGYQIVPIGIYGGENCFDILWDSADYTNTRIGQFLKDRGLLERYLRGAEELPPIVKGLGPTLLPRPERIYYTFGKPITPSMEEELPGELALVKTRNKVQQSIESAIESGRQAHLKDHKSGTVSPWRSLFSKQLSA